MAVFAHWQTLCVAHSTLTWPTRRCFGLPTPNSAGGRRLFEVTDGSPNQGARPSARSIGRHRRWPSPRRRPHVVGSRYPARRRSEAAHLALGLRAPEIVDRCSCLFGRLEHGSEPARHLRKAQEG